ncbi:MAG: NFYB/HAP3 family transcription factor subunit [Candidatus Nanohaloarchaeota archaeon QJJ-5]|nr:NFYB/HAP3 family transcription factor subunit [Candidatus Nanohaloarchaeota archaeon QJJ-5]
MAELPRAPLERLLRQAGAERVSDEATEALREAVEEEALELAERAREFSQHANRKTVQREDVRAARRDR